MTKKTNTEKLLEKAAELEASAKELRGAAKTARTPQERKIDKLQEEIETLKLELAIWKAAGKQTIVYPYVRPSPYTQPYWTFNGTSTTDGASYLNDGSSSASSFSLKSKWPADPKG